MHILLIVSRSKSNQPMKFGQLLECNMRNIFPEQSCTNCDGETCHRLFSEKLKLSISLDISSLKFPTVCFCLASCGLSKFIETKLQTTCFHLILGFLNTQKKVWNQSSCLNFCIIFEEKYFCYILLIDQFLLSGCLYFVRYWAICVLKLFVNQVVTS